MNALASRNYVLYA